MTERVRNIGIVVICTIGGLFFWWYYGFGGDKVVDPFVNRLLR